MVVSVLQVDEEQRLRALARPSLRSVEKADSWSATVPTRDGATTVSWHGDRITAAVGSVAIDATLLNKHRRIRRAAQGDRLGVLRDGNTLHADSRELTDYRYRLSGLFAVLISLQEVAAFVLRKHARAALVPFRILTSVLWPLFAAYCAYVFLG